MRLWRPERPPAGRGDSLILDYWVLITEMLCGLANVAGMNHDEAPSLHPWPVRSKAVAGRVVASAEGSPERSVPERLPQPDSRILPWQLELRSCAERTLLFAKSFCTNYSKPRLQIPWYQFAPPLLRCMALLCFVLRVCEDI